MAIGGYFEAEDKCYGRFFTHADGKQLNTGRNALEFILRTIGRIEKIYLPFYTCPAVLEPIKKLRIPWVYYSINNQLEINIDIKLGQNDYIIVNNYFGIKDSYIKNIASRFGPQLIVDNAQALLTPAISGIYSFYSPRKFVGVADGGIAYVGDSPLMTVDIHAKEQTEEHDAHLLIRKKFGAEAGFEVFQENEKKLANLPIRLMSDKTKAILNHIDYRRILKKRKDNFKVLHHALFSKNQLSIPDINEFACPMVYPFFADNNAFRRKVLIAHKIFVAKYWPDLPVLPDYPLESDFVGNLIPLPCDQRYGQNEMNQIINLLNL